MQENTNLNTGATRGAPLYSAIRDGAAKERFKASGDFFDWVVRKRHATEHQVWSTRRSLRESMLYAERALLGVSVGSYDQEEAPFRGVRQPATLVVSPVVVDFAASAVELCGHEIFLAQLDVLYPMCYGREGDDLIFEPRDAATVQFLWDEYHKEREKREMEESEE